MKLNLEHEAFIKDFIEGLDEKRAAIFAGAGLSVGAGYVDWKELLRDIANEIGLDVDKEGDLISLAQYHYNEKRGRSRLNKKILDVFTRDVDITKNHEILARLPVETFWTTNYDRLIEKSLERYNKIVDVKHEISQMPNSKSKRDAIVYKMHGDAEHSANAIITRDDYEKYFQTHEPFINALKGDLTTKTFLFIGFSFNDPNLEYVLSRVRLYYRENANHHYCILKNVREKDFKRKADFDYHKRRQQLRIEDLKNYQITPVLINEYNELTDIFYEIERRYKRKSIFISGSAEEYDKWGRERAIKLIHKLSGKIVSKGYKVVNGFGWGVGSAVINGALEQIYLNPKRHSEDQLVIKPFPQFSSGDKDLPTLWKEYRERMISLTGIAIFIFGNKIDKESGNIINANGVKQEFDIAISQGCIPIPIGSTGYISQELYKVVSSKIENYLPKDVIEDFKILESETNTEEILRTVVRIIDHINNT